MAILSETSRINDGHTEVIHYKLMNDQSALNTTSDAIDTLDADAVTLIVETGAGVSGGVVTLEGAASSDYSGTWISFGTITTSAASTAYGLSVAPTNDVSAGAGLPMPYMRARISTVITGGTIDVYLTKKR